MRNDHASFGRSVRRICGLMLLLVAAAWFWAGSGLVLAFPSPLVALQQDSQERAADSTPARVAEEDEPAGEASETSEEPSGEETDAVEPAVFTPVTLAARLAEIYAGGVPESLDDLRTMEIHQRDLVERVLPATVAVRVGAAQGSGVIISPDGYVLTAAHVSGEPDREVVFFLNDGTTVRGKTLGLYRSVDAGLMQITEPSDEEWPYVEMGSSADVQPGQWVLATGHPGGYQPDRGTVVRVGRVLSKRRSVLVTDCKLVGGDSGGPLFNMEGEVIGIHSRIGGQLTANLHVPIDSYHDSFDAMARGETVGRIPGLSGGPIIGVRGTADADEARIEQVYSGLPADRAGMQPGDVVIRFDGEEVTTFESLRKLVAASEAGDEIEVVVQRDDEELELLLVLDPPRSR